MKTTFTLFVLLICANTHGSDQQTTDGPLADQDTNQKFSDFLSTLVSGDEALGIEVYVVQGDKEVFHEAVGWMDRENNRPMQKNAIYNIRSMTKPMAGTVFQKLVDRGQIKLSDTVASYLPEFNGPKTREITIEQLLLHRGGFEQGPPGKPWSRCQSLEEITDYWAQTGPTLRPGAQWSYADAHADIAASVASRVTGKSGAQLFQEMIFEPLGLKQTFAAWTPDRQLLEQVAPLYRSRNGVWTKFWSRDDGRFYPFTMYSQSVYSSVKDYAKYVRCYLPDSTENPIVSRAGIERTFANRDAIGVPPSMFPVARGKQLFYGHFWGFVRDESDSLFAFTHQGSDGTAAYAFPNSGVVAIVMTQSRGTQVLPKIEAKLVEYFARR